MLKSKACASTVWLVRVFYHINRIKKMAELRAEVLEVLKLEQATDAETQVGNRGPFCVKNSDQIHQALKYPGDVSIHGTIQCKQRARVAGSALPCSFRTMLFI